MPRLSCILAPILIGCAGGVVEEDPTFPKYHVRPASGHVNDPNGPFYDPRNDRYHLFMQYRPNNPGAPKIGMEWGHFASDDLVTWTFLDIGIPSDGKGCPNTGGVFSGSAAVLDGVPSIAYPGVHTVDKSAAHPDGIGMAQCLARPRNLSDPWLREWESVVIVPTDPMPGDVDNHYHDDAEPWQSASDKRWYTFASGGNKNRDYGVNLLYSISDEEYRGSLENMPKWRFEHALWNITTGQCSFVSCPEMYSLPSTPAGTPRTSGKVVYEAFCGCDQYWIGQYDDEAHTFTPEPEYTQKTAARYCYDYGEGKASKSFWDVKTNRRIMWSWITMKRPANGTWDGAQTVPREITMGPAQGRAPELRINPIAEVDQLRKSGAPLVDKLVDVVAAGTEGVAFSVESDASGERVNNQIDLLVNLTWPECNSAGPFSEPIAAGISVLGTRAAGGVPVTFELVRSSALFMPNFNLPQGDIVSLDFKLNASVAWTDATGGKACADACNAHEECTGWVYVRPVGNAAGDGGPRCAIKGDKQTEPPVPDANTVSGYKTAAGHNIPNATVASIGVGEQGMLAHMSGNNEIRLRILIDHSILEVYDGTGALSLSRQPVPDRKDEKIEIYAISGEGIKASVRAHAMRGAVSPDKPRR